MPRYAYSCDGCGAKFDELHTSFGAAERAERDGVICTECGSRRTARDEIASMKGGAFRRWGLWTYDGNGNPSLNG